MGTHIRACWVSYDPDQQNISNFLLDWKPSTTKALEYEWICVSRQKAVKSSNYGIRGLLSAWEGLCAAKMNDVTCLDAQHLAEEHNVVSGKWLIFVPTKHVDEAWAIVARAVIVGLLGNDAKVSTLHYIDKSKVKAVSLDDNVCKASTSKAEVSNLKVKPKAPVVKDSGHVICVYANDFNDIDHVFEIREKLVALGFKDKLSFKPDGLLFLRNICRE